MTPCFAWPALSPREHHPKGEPPPRKRVVRGLRPDCLADCGVDSQPPPAAPRWAAAKTLADTRQPRGGFQTGDVMSTAAPANRARRPNTRRPGCCTRPHHLVAIVGRTVLDRDDPGVGAGPGRNVGSRQAQTRARPPVRRGRRVWLRGRCGRIRDRVVDACTGRRLSHKPVRKPVRQSVAGQHWSCRSECATRWDDAGEIGPIGVLVPPLTY
jgi:hypothetical protein